MAMQMGYLEKEQTKQKSSGLQELKAQKYSIEDKTRWVYICAVLRIRDPGSSPFLAQGSGIRNNFFPEAGSYCIN
jgi:hypothetical protein